MASEVSFTVFKRTSLLFLTWPSWVQSMPSHSTSLRSSLIAFRRPRTDLPSNFHLQIFWTSRLALLPQSLPCAPSISSFLTWSPWASLAISKTYEAFQCVMLSILCLLSPFQTQTSSSTLFPQSFFHQLMPKWNVLKTILKFTLKLT